MIVNYVISALKYATVFSCIYIFIKYIYLRYRKKKIIIKSELPYIIFIAYLAALLSQTIIPIWNIFTIDGKLSIEISTYNARHLNLYPFKTIMGYITQSNNIYGGVAYTDVRIVNLLGNICLFVPFGFLFPITFNRVSKERIIILFGTLLSIFIEIMQFVVERSSDIDDVILNCVGVIIGLTCYKIIKKFYTSIQLKT